MDKWIRCNKCAYKPAPDLIFHLTACRHVLCDKCYRKISNGCCPHCGQKAAPATELTSDCPRSIQTFFHPLDEVFRVSLEVLEFQRRQQLITLRNITAKYELAKKEVQKQFKIAMACKSENQKLIGIKQSWNLRMAHHRHGNFVRSNNRVANSSCCSTSTVVATPSFMKNEHELGQRRQQANYNNSGCKPTHLFSSCIYEQQQQQQQQRLQQQQQQPQQPQQQQRSLLNNSRLLPLVSPSPIRNIFNRLKLNSSSLSPNIN